MNNMSVVFDLGETRHVKLLIHSCKNDPFEVASASYSLTKKGEAEPEDEGAAVIYGHMLDMVITPKEKGYYNLQVVYHIADEVLIENIGVMVV